MPDGKGRGRKWPTKEGNKGRDEKWREGTGRKSMSKGMERVKGR